MFKHHHKPPTTAYKPPVVDKELKEAKWDEDKNQLLSGIDFARATGMGVCGLEVDGYGVWYRDGSGDSYYISFQLMNGRVLVGGS